MTLPTYIPPVNAFCNRKTAEEKQNKKGEKSKAQAQRPPSTSHKVTHAIGTDIETARCQGEETDDRNVNKTAFFIKGIKWVSWASKNSRATVRVKADPKTQKQKQKQKTETIQKHMSDERELGTALPVVSLHHPVQSINQSIIPLSSPPGATPARACSLSMLSRSPSLFSHAYMEAMPLLTLAGLPATMTCEGWDCGHDQSAIIIICGQGM